MVKYVTRQNCRHVLLDSELTELAKILKINRVGTTILYMPTSTFLYCIYVPYLLLHTMSAPSDLDSLRSRIEQLEREVEETKQQGEQERERAAREREAERQQAAHDIAAEKQRAEDANQRAEHERQQAEDANQRAEHERQQAEEQQRRTRPTTFDEYVAACHDHFQSALSVETDRRFTTKGFTSVKNKYYPKFLRQWVEFPKVQQQRFDSIRDFFRRQPAGRFFNSVQFIQELAANLRLRRLASEKDLETYERMAVEDVATAIFRKLSGMPEAQAELGLGERVEFYNHANSLSDTAEEVQERLHLRTPQTSPEPSSSPESEPESESESEPETSSQNPSRLPRSRPDQFCVYGHHGETQKLLFFVEYKPPHKLSVGNLRAGLRDMDVGAEVINRPTIPSYVEKPEGEMTADDEYARQEKLQYNADKLIGAIATQVFDSMIDYGLEYSYLTTGEAVVFFQVREDDPETLYYHLSIPGEEVEKEPQTRLWQTAVSQILSLCTITFRSDQRSHDWRTKARTSLAKAQIDWEAVLRGIPESERKRTPQSSAYRGRKNANPKNSPYTTRQFAKDRCRNDSDSDSDEDSPNTFDQTQGSPSYSRGGSKTGDKRVPKCTDNQGSDQRHDNSRQQNVKKADLLPYCTQACLLSLAQEKIADRDCPNVELHPMVNHYHAIDVGKLTALVRTQLAADPDQGCKPLGSQGARGALFRINLLSHGYVFVAKGTVRAFVTDMSHETIMYRRLKPLQGKIIPVCLGHIRLKRRYYLDLGVKIRHMLLLSWGGKEIDDGLADKNHEIRKTVGEVLKAGIDQRDARSPNLLWNEERQRVMLVDFERAVAVSPPKRPVSGITGRGSLQDLSPNKRPKFLQNSEMKANLCFSERRVELV